MPNSRLIVDCEMLRANYAKLGNCIPVVKANAYGLGAYEVASLLQAPLVAVSHEQEAIDLRLKGYSKPILTFSCLDVGAAFDHEIIVALNSLEEAKRLHREGERRKAKIQIHLQLDLALHRLGFSEEEAFAALPFIQKSPYLELEGVMCHFVSPQEIARFEAFVEVVRPRVVHTGRLPSPFPMRVGMALFENAATLETRVLHIHRCKKGEPIGYFQEVAQKDMRLATLGIGYHDGLNLHGSGKGHVYISGQKAAYLSNIYMDFLVVDVTDLAVSVGDRAEIFGPHIPLQEVADWASTNRRQLLCCVGPRVKREYVNIRESLGAGQAHCAL